MTAEGTLQGEQKTDLRPSTQITAAPPGDGSPARIEPDLDFIRRLRRQGGDTVKQCFQCGTCSATCDLSTDENPFPCQQMAWASWGMRDRLLASPNLWLCHQCNDCSARCPRGARPGDVLGAARQESVHENAVPRFMAEWAGRPHCIPLLLGIPAALLTGALLVRDPIANALALNEHVGERIVYPHSPLFPHWLLNTFFGIVVLFVVLASVAGVRRFWGTLKSGLPAERRASPVQGVWTSLRAALRSAITHDKFDKCTRSRTRLVWHVCVFFGFIALTMVTFWVITARYNPLIRGDFVYPFAFFYPWKMLANAGGIALVAGCLLMIRDRLREGGDGRTGSYFDYALIGALLIVGVTGFATEAMHYLRLEPHRHVAYFIHLVFVGALLLFLPYSKLAHMFYRTTALVFIERFGVPGHVVKAPAGVEPDATQEGQDDDGDTAVSESP